MSPQPKLIALLLLLLTIGDGLLVFNATQAQAVDSSDQFLLTYPKLENPGGEVLLDNEHVVLQRFILKPGEWEGIHSHPGNQLWIHINGGELSARAGAKTLYEGSVSEPGTVGWMDAIPLAQGYESGNTGDTPMELIWVTLKGEGPITPDREVMPVFYPNIPLEMLFENDRLIVQRVIVEPGEWEGVHSHPGNQLYVHIEGGVWSSRRGDDQTPPYAYAEAGSVFWMDEIPITEKHQSGNSGDTTIDMLWITLK